MARDFSQANLESSEGHCPVKGGSVKKGLRQPSFSRRVHQLRQGEERHRQVQDRTACRLVKSTGQARGLLFYESGPRP